MNLKRVYLFAILTSFIFALSGYFVFELNVSLGILVGTIAGLAAMTFLVSRFKDIDLTDYKYLSKSMSSNLAIRYLIYLISLLLGIFVPSLFHVLAIFIGIILVKVCVYIDAFTNKEK